MWPVLHYLRSSDLTSLLDKTSFYSTCYIMIFHIFPFVYFTLSLSTIELAFNLTLFLASTLDILQSWLFSQRRESHCCSSIRRWQSKGYNKGQKWKLNLNANKSEVCPFSISTLPLQIWKKKPELTATLVYLVLSEIEFSCSTHKLNAPINHSDWIFAQLGL